MRNHFIIILIISLVISALADYLPYQNLSNSLENSHHSNLVLTKNDSIYVFWIEGSNKLHSRILHNNSWSPTNQIYSCNASKIIEELTASSNDDSTYLFWTERDSATSIYSGMINANTLSCIDTVYQSTNLIEKLKSRQGRSLGWYEKNSIFSDQAGLNIKTIPNLSLFFIDSCQVYTEYSLEYDENGKLNVYWIKNGCEINYKSLIDSITWSSTNIIPPSNYYFKDIYCSHNSVNQNFDIALAGDLVTGWYSNGLIYVDGNDSSWSSFEEIMPVGASSPFQEFDVSEYPQVLVQSDGKCLVLFQNTFYGQSSTTNNIYLARKDNLGDWIIRKNLVPGQVYLNSSAVDSDDSLYFTFEKDNDVYIGGNDLVVGIELNIDIEDIQDFQLFQNYPNPFNPETTIRYAVPQNGRVTISIYNVLGEEIKTLVDQFHTPGSYSVVWDGTDNLNNSVSSGIYIYKIEADNFQKSMKMIYTK